tara:strand:+ start:957 stop:1607 length:651 start_codon:yes stop_codon:yes gene_type:complete
MLFRRPRYARVALSADAREERYTFFDSILYVGLLCAAGTIVSFASNLPLERVLGLNFVTGWFSLDLLWAEHNHFGKLEHSPWAVLSFALGIATAIACWWAWHEEPAFLFINAAGGTLLAAYWVLSEENVDTILSRGCVKVLSLYAFATSLGIIVCYIQAIPFKVHPWYVAFVLNAIAVQQRTPVWWTRFLHGFTWGVLVYELGRDQLIFSKFFYGV